MHRTTPRGRDRSNQTPDTPRALCEHFTAQNINRTLRVYLDLYHAQDSVLKNHWGVVFRQDRLDQNILHEVSGGHVDVEFVSAVLHTGLQNLQQNQKKDSKDSVK